MGWGTGSNGHRDIGYMIPAYCDHPDCTEEIDRGLSYCCGGEPWSDAGCGLYFCGDHLNYGLVDAEGNLTGYDDDAEEEEDDSGWTSVDLCERCLAGEAPFLEKPDHPTWVWWKLNHESWDEWRQEYPWKVEQMTQYLTDLAFIPSEDLVDSLHD